MAQVWLRQHDFKKIKDSLQKHMIKSYCIFTNCGFAIEPGNNYIENKFVLKREQSGKAEKWDKEETMQDSSRDDRNATRKQEKWKRVQDQRSNGKLNNMILNK